MAFQKRTPPPSGWPGRLPRERQPHGQTREELRCRNPRRWAQINLEQRHAWIHAAQSKNRRPIAIPLNDAAYAVLMRQKGKHLERVFTFQVKPLNSANTRAWQRALKRAGIADFRWHDLRHTWATWQRQAGTPTHELQRLGGWRTGAMVERYAHLAPDHLAVAASRLDSVFAGYDLAT